MAKLIRGASIAGILVIVGVLPVVYFRAVYAHAKRLHVVEEGRVYRSGQMTAAGFADAVHVYGLKTIVNLQDDFPDPDVQVRFLSEERIKESELCEQLGVRYLSISPDLISRRLIGERRPAAIDHFLAIMDDPANYPILFHCKAGLHRTGILAAVYRMEYQGWSHEEAYRELKAHGFGVRACTAANDYVQQYVLTYRPHRRVPAGIARGKH